jgi:urease accessory protein
MLVLKQEPPWRAIRAFRNEQNQSLVHLHNVSGGILSGDSLELSIEAGAATRIQITSVGATRIYRSRPNRPPSRLATFIRVGDGAMLEFLPDAVIPFAGSRFQQCTAVSLGTDSGLIWWETVSAGRVARREEFEFDVFSSECSIHSDARPLALERYSLTPSTRNPRSVARWGRFRYTATLYVCHTGIGSRRWSELESCLNELASSLTSHAARWGVSTLIAGGLVIRGLALEAHSIAAGLHKFWARAKEELWGEPAIAPRKIN